MTFRFFATQPFNKKCTSLLLSLLTFSTLKYTCKCMHVYQRCIVSPLLTVKSPQESLKSESQIESIADFKACDQEPFLPVDEVTIFTIVTSESFSSHSRVASGHPTPHTKKAYPLLPYILWSMVRSTAIWATTPELASECLAARMPKRMATLQEMWQRFSMLHVMFW